MQTLGESLADKEPSWQQRILQVALESLRQAKARERTAVPSTEENTSVRPEHGVGL